ncbi:uncharacterized protein LOC128763108 [Synchiropus splendidus]|uniref:uncharacterized protein LOC128763108 n=1 Tax=Synchiropus splendidus TaxID=270530 RepID=UPI00237D6517|nr:uncharacterized protein LOC128763108 [Synchiropus splendidus]
MNMDQMDQSSAERVALSNMDTQGQSGGEQLRGVDRDKAPPSAATPGEDHDKQTRPQSSKQLPSFESGPGLRSQYRPAPRYMSVKSDRSISRMIDFKAKHESGEQRFLQEKPEESELCGVSMSDWSRARSIDFRGAQESLDKREDQLISDVQQHETDVDSTMQHLDMIVLNQVKRELKRVHRFLSPDDQTHLDDEEEEELMCEEEQMRCSREAFLKYIVNILRSMKNEELADRLWSRSLAAGCKGRLKRSLQKKFHKVFEGVAKAGSSTPLNQIYTELFITEGGTDRVNQEHEVRQIEAAARTQTRPETTIRPEDLFTASPDKDRPIRCLLTKGVAGIGKTLLTQKVTLDWAENKAHQNFHLVFPFTFRELNLLKEKQLSLVELVHLFFPETKDSGLSSFEGVQVLFILDGLDECRLPLDFNSRVLTAATESTSVDVLLTNLIRGKLLPSARLWITSRPAAANQIPPECVDMVTEVRGFTDLQKEEYFRKRFKDEVQTTIISHIRSSRSLYIMCHIPIFCWITATVLEDMLKSRESGELPKTLTEMYVHFLVVQAKVKKLKYHGGSGTDEVWDPESRKMIEALGKLAFEQLRRGNLIFYESDLTECGIDVTAASVYSGVFTQIFREERGLYQDKVFCFVHLSLQEFLAALHVHLKFFNSGVNLLDSQQTQKVPRLLRNRLHTEQFYLRAINEAVKSLNRHLDLFLRFLLGLSLPTTQSLFPGLLTQTGIHSWTHQDTAKLIKKKISKKVSPERIINLFHCLNEVKDTSLVEEVQQQLRSGSLSTDQLSPAQWSALVFILVSSEEHLRVFDLQKYCASEEALERLLPVVQASNEVLLRDCRLSEGSGSLLASVLSSPSSSLTHLDLSNNKLEDPGVELLSAGLESPHCHLETLRLRMCDLSQRSCSLLASVLSSPSSSLTHLDLSNNRLEDTGVELLSAGLESPHCHLETLRSEHSSSPLQFWSTTGWLFFSFWRENFASLLSIKVLCHCDIGIFHRLCFCQLSQRSCSHLASVLSSPSSSLTHLDLTNNTLEDPGVELLSAGLESPHCHLETLRLVCCQLSQRSGSLLASVLSSPSSSLTQLDLSNNDLEDSIVELLSAGLKSPHCHLETLRLCFCQLSPRSGSLLASVLSSPSSSLTQLDLSNNTLFDSGVELLSAGLESPHCHLETLGLRFCQLSQTSGSLLASVLSSPSSSLTHLDLSNNNLEDSGVELLSVGLESPHCHLETLSLSGCMVSQRGCASLASALSLNPSHLRELDLSSNLPDGPGLELLSAALNSPDWRLETGGTLWITILNNRNSGTGRVLSFVRVIHMNMDQMDQSSAERFALSNMDTQGQSGGEQLRGVDRDKAPPSASTPGEDHDKQTRTQSSKQLPSFESGPGLRSQYRPAPRYMSVKSDRSISRMIDFKAKNESGEQRFLQEKPEESELCGVSMSDWSRARGIDFRGAQESLDKREDQLISDVQQHETDVDSTMQHLDVIVLNQVKRELKRVHRFLSPGDQTHLDDEEEEELMCEEEQMRCSREAFLKYIVNILRSMKNEELADRLWSRSLAAGCKGQLKRSLQKKFHRVFEGVAKAGSSAPLNQIYTELYITEGGTDRVNQEHEVRQIEAATRTQTRPETTIRPEDLFTASPDKERPIRCLLTKGVAGIGKTLLTQKLTLDWAENKAHQNFHLVFPFTFRELNLLKEKQLSLVELVHLFFPETKDSGLSSLEGVQVLFILDGLDECRLPLDFNSRVLTAATGSTSVDVLLTNLIRGKLLPSARLWITSRPAAANQISPECVDMVTEVRGFTDLQKEEYFRKRFKDEEQTTIISHIRSSRSLYIMCHIPIFCWITASVLEDMLKSRESGELPKTLTEMYVHFLVVQAKVKKLKYHGGSGTDEVWDPESRKMIEALGKLAFEQLQRGNLIFYESDLTECGIDITAAAVYSGVFTQIFREERGLYQDKVFCFVHLSLQEFLAALYVHLKFFNSGVNVLDSQQTQKVPRLLRNRLHTEQFYLRAINEAVKSSNGHLDLFLRFLLGLSLPTTQSLFPGLLTQTGIHSWTHQDTAKLIKKKISKKVSPERIINLFHCLNEVKDTSLVEEVQQQLRSGSLSTDQLSPAQWSALVFILVSSEEHLRVFDLQKYCASEEALERLLPVVQASNEVLLRDCRLSERSGSLLASVLSSPSSSLTHLDLTNNTLFDSGVELLSAGLESPHCHLETLRLHFCRLTQRSCSLLASVLSSPSSCLIHLDLSNNKLKDSGVELLSAGLKSPHCHLETLRLHICQLSYRSGSLLASVLSSPSSSLTHLDLSYNNLEDSGVELLSAGLKSPHCHLETLRLWVCQLSERSGSLLASVLSSPSSSLTHLDLSYNNLEDSGVELLSAGLRSPHCHLETLSLSGCMVSQQGCASLASALSLNPSHLRELDLSSNLPEGPGLELLSAGLNSPDWRLETLRVDDCGLQH